MDKSVQITAIIVAGMVFLGLLIAGSIANLNPVQSNTITVDGMASIDALPDLVVVYFSVESKSQTSEGATQDNALIVSQLKDNLVAQGFDRQEIKTQSFNVNKNYEWRSKEYTENGYIAVHTLKLEIPADESDRVGEAIDAAVDAGAGISYINFELSQEKQNEYKAEAIKLAAQDAKTKAQAVADGFDKDLGALVSTSMSSFDYYPWRLYESAGSVSADAAMAKEAATNINPTEQEISARVSAVYKLK